MNKTFSITWQAVWVELLKARRSKTLPLTGLAFTILPLVGGLFMVIMKDPELARRLGIISAKAQIVAGDADWPTFLGILAQGTAVGGIMLFGFIGTWVFGREYADQTIKDLLALPTPRSAIVLAKFVVVILWAAAAVAGIYLLGLGVGAVVRLPPLTAEAFWQSSLTLAVTAVLTIALVTPVCFFASAGGGYLAPLAAAILALVAAQIAAAMGWGEYFPWSVPALRTGMAGPQYASMGGISYTLVLLTSLAGMAMTFAWWELADQR